MTEQDIKDSADFSNFAQRVKESWFGQLRAFRYYRRKKTREDDLDDLLLIAWDEMKESKGWDKDCAAYHCSDGIHTSWWLAILRTEEWKVWAKHAQMLYDISEVEECGWMSEKHAKDFLAFVKGKRSKCCDGCSDVNCGHCK